MNDPLDGYNPFVGEQRRAQPANWSNIAVEGGEKTTKTTLNQGISLSPPAQTPTVISSGQPQQQTGISSEDFLRRQEELERKALELERREEELRNRQLEYNAIEQKNWPPLPKKFCVEPCFYQDINLEIGVEFQKIVRTLYYVWLLHTLLYVLNIGGCLALFIEFGSGTMFGLSVLYCLLFVPASYLFWFRPVYKAFKLDSSFNFMVFFVFFFAQFSATVIQTIGFPSLGTCGFIVGLAAIGGHTDGGSLAVGIIVLILACGFGVLAFFDFLLLVNVSRLYRSSGGSFSKARAEFTSDVMRNEHVRGVAADAVGSVVRAQMDNITGNQRV